MIAHIRKLSCPATVSVEIEKIREELLELAPLADVVELDHIHYCSLSWRCEGITTPGFSTVQQAELRTLTPSFRLLL